VEALSGAQNANGALAGSGNFWSQRGSGSGGTRDGYSNRHSRKETVQLKAEVARLNGGICSRGNSCAAQNKRVRP